MDRPESGFATLTMLILVPALLTVLIALATAYFIFERQALSQSVCVQESVQAQLKLAEVLKRLLNLNPRARTLRRQRAAADRAVAIAARTGMPQAIASAKAVQTAVKLLQASLRGAQLRLLAEAREARVDHERRLANRLRSLRTSPVRSQALFPLPLAVLEQPLGSASPDFIPARPFERLQQQRFRFQVDLQPPFLPRDWAIGHLRLDSECSATLTPEKDRWQVRILAASAPSR